MVDRKKFDHALAMRQQLEAHYPDRNFQNAFQLSEELRDHFEIKLLVVGHFSAGKSALLNALLQRPAFLKEAQQPQTALATELVYDTTEQAFAYRKDGSCEELQAGKEYLPDEYSHLEYHVNAPALARIADYTIVDTPGFDSGIEAHAQALSNYIGVGSAYLVVVDQEKGGLDETTLQFIREISHYSDQIAVVLNKCDKITPDTVEQIVSAAQGTLEMWGFPYKVYPISARAEDCCTQLESILGQFHAQKAFDRIMTRQLRIDLENTEKLLQIEQRKLSLDTHDLDESLRNFERSKKQLADAFDQKTQQAQDKLDPQTETTLASVRQALTAHADTISTALLNGNQTAVKAIILETIRPVLVASMKNIVSGQIDAITAELQFDQLVHNDMDAEDLVTMTTNLASNLKSLIDSGTFTPAPQSGLGKHKKDDRNNTLYHAITGVVAAATDAIAPWLEVIIILLPDIIHLLEGLFAEKDEDIVKRNFINNVIPQICNKLYPQIRTNIETSTREVQAAYKSMLDEKLEQLQDSIASIKEQKAQKVETFAAYQGYITEDIAAIQKMLQQLR